MHLLAAMNALTREEAMLHHRKLKPFLPIREDTSILDAKVVTPAIDMAFEIPVTVKPFESKTKGTMLEKLQ